MTDAIAHRGPDGEGHYVDGADRPRPSPAGDHRSVADAARQPMRNEAGDVLLDLQRRDLQLPRAARRARGARAPLSTPRTDTEVIVHAYEEWGDDCVDALQRHVRVRDRGIGRTQPAVPGARSLRHQAAVLLARRRHVRVRLARSRRCCCTRACACGVDPHALLEYFTFQNLFTDRTLFDGIRLLPPGR